MIRHKAALWIAVFTVPLSLAYFVLHDLASALASRFSAGPQTFVSVVAIVAAALVAGMIANLRISKWLTRR